MTHTLRRTLDALVIVLPPLVIAAGASATRGLWSGEIPTLQAASTSWAALVAALARDSHPPLHVLLVKGWIGLFGDGEVGLRMLQALQGMLLVGVTLALQRKLLPAARWHLFFVLFVLAPALWLYMPMLRCHTLAAALATALTLVHVRWIAAPTRALDAGRIVLSLALLLTDHSTSIVIALHLVHTALVRRDLVVRHLVTTVVTALAFAPWLVFSLTRSVLHPGIPSTVVPEGVWVSVPLKVAWALYALVAGETSLPIDPWVIATLVALVPVVAIPRLRGRLFAAEGSGLLLLLVLGGIASTAFVTTFGSQDASVPSTPAHTLHALPALFLLLGMWYDEVPLAWLRRLIGVVLVVCALPSLWSGLAGRSYMMPAYASPWKQIVTDTRGGHVLSDEADSYAWYAARTPGASVLINDWDSTRVEALLADSTARIFTVMSDRDGTARAFDMSTFFQILARVEPVWRRVYVPYDDNWRMMRAMLLNRDAGEGKFTVHEMRPISRARLDALTACQDGAPY